MEGQSTRTLISLPRARRLGSCNLYLPTAGREDSSSDIFDEALELDGLTLFTEVSAALVVGVGGKEGTIGGEDVEGEKA